MAEEKYSRGFSRIISGMWNCLPDLGNLQPALRALCFRSSFFQNQAAPSCG